MGQNPNFLSVCCCVLTHSPCLILNLWVYHTLAIRYSFHVFKIFARKYKCLICYVACGWSSLLMLFTWVIPAIWRHHLKYFTPSRLLSFLPSLLHSLPSCIFSLYFPFLFFYSSILSLAIQISFLQQLVSVPLGHASKSPYTHAS